MELTVRIDGQRYRYPNIQTFRTKHGGPEQPFKLSIDNKDVLTSTTSPDEVIASDSGTPTVDESNPTFNLNHPLNEVETLGRHPDTFDQSYQTLPYDLYQVMDAISAYQVLVTAYLRTNKHGTATRDIVEVTEALRPESEVSQLDFDNTYDFERSTPPFGDDPSSIINTIYELSEKDKYWVMLPERLYYVAASDVARDILATAGNNFTRDSRSFSMELIDAIKEHGTDAQQSALSIKTKLTA